MIYKFRYLLNKQAYLSISTQTPNAVYSIKGRVLFINLRINLVVMSYLLTVIMACSSGSSSDSNSADETTNSESPINPTPSSPSGNINDEAALGEANAYSVGGTVAGLNGGTIVVQNNSVDSLVLDQDGKFTFTSKLNRGESYSVRIVQPLSSPSLPCFISGANGIAESTDINNISIVCPVLQRTEISSNLSRAAVDSDINFNLSGLYSMGLSRDLTQYAEWSSSDTSVASISANGVFSAIAPGQVTVTAAYSGVTKSKVVTVTSASLSSISIAPPQPNFSLGGKVALRAIGIYSDNSTQDLTQKVQWTSSDELVIEKDASVNGLMKGLAPGTAIISAEFKGVSVTTNANVNATGLSSIEISPLISKAAVGASTQYYATGINDDNTRADLTTLVAWSSSDNSVASIDNQGVLSRHKAGVVTITASQLGINASVTSEVLGAQLVSVEIEPSSLNIAQGVNRQFKAMGVYDDNSRSDLTDDVVWSTSDNTIAAITNSGKKGLFEATQGGSVDVQASILGVSAVADVTVNAETIIALEIQPKRILMTKGVDQQFNLVGTDSSGNQYDLTEQALWLGSDSSVGLMSNLEGSKGTLNNVYAGDTNATSSISATYAGISAAAELIVTPSSVKDLWINPTSLSVATQQSTQLTAVANFEDGASMNVTEYVTWSSDNVSVAGVSNAVSGSGMLTSLSEGSANIMCSFEGLSATQIISVNNDTSGVSVSEGHGIKASYYRNRFLDESGLAGVRTDTKIDYNWDKGAAPLGVGDDFSVRFEGYILADYDDDYTFCTDSDDGVRLYIDDNLVIDDWTDHAVREDCSMPISLSAGQRVKLKLEFYERGGHAVIRLKWKSSMQTSDMKNIIDQKHLFTE